MSSLSYRTDRFPVGVESKSGLSCLFLGFLDRKQLDTQMVGLFWMIWRLFSVYIAVHRDIFLY